MVLRAVTAAAMAVALAPAVAAALPADSPPTGRPATCAQQSSASFPRAFASPDNLVVGPLALVGGRRATPPATVDRIGGQKFPALVRARHTVTVAVSRPADRSASLFYAMDDGPTERRVGNGHRAMTFHACGARRSQSDVDGAPVTFWSGFVLVSKPMCVRLKVWIDDHRTPRRSRIALGRSC